MLSCYFESTNDYVLSQFYLNLCFYAPINLFYFVFFHLNIAYIWISKTSLTYLSLHLGPHQKFPYLLDFSFWKMCDFASSILSNFAINVSFYSSLSFSLLSPQNAYTFIKNLSPLYSVIHLCSLYVQKCLLVFESEGKSVWAKICV